MSLSNIRDLITARFASGSIGSITAEKMRDTLEQFVDQVIAERIAANVTYSSPTAPLTAENVEAALDEVANVLNLKAALADPAFTGTPTAPTATAGNSSTQLATTAFVATALANLVDSAPGTLDSLNELAAALGDDPAFATTMTNALAGKLAKQDGNLTGWTDLDEIATPANPAANKARLYAFDDGGVTKVAFRDSAGTETVVGGGGSDGDFAVGSLAMFPTTGTPTGWLKANGALVSRTIYASLWDFANTMAGALATEANWSAGDYGLFGEGDGSTTFRLPDFRGYFPRIADDARGIDSGRSLGSLQDGSAVATGRRGGSLQIANHDGTYGTNSGSYYFAAHSSFTDSQLYVRPKNVSVALCVKY